MFVFYIYIYLHFHWYQCFVAALTSQTSHSSGELIRIYSFSAQNVCKAHRQFTRFAGKSDCPLK